MCPAHELPRLIPVDFDDERERLHHLCLQLRALCAPSFEQRFHVLTFRFSLHDLMYPPPNAVALDQGTYGIFIGSQGELRYTRLSEVETAVARKLKEGDKLSRPERQIALLILNRL